MVVFQVNSPHNRVGRLLGRDRVSAMKISALSGMDLVFCVFVPAPLMPLVASPVRSEHRKRRGVNQPAPVEGREAHGDSAGRNGDSPARRLHPGRLTMSGSPFCSDGQPVGPLRGIAVELTRGNPPQPCLGAVATAEGA